MSSSGTIEHLGIVKEISSNQVIVSIVQQSACGSCNVRGACSISDTNEKIIDVARLRDESYVVGEQIRVILEQSLGIKALGLGYMLPFLILLAILVTMVSMGINEGLAGITALASLAPYYIVLFFFRDRLKKEFSFRLKKL